MNNGAKIEFVVWDAYELRNAKCHVADVFEPLIFTSERRNIDRLTPPVSGLFGLGDQQIVHLLGCIPFNDHYWQWLA